MSEPGWIQDLRREARDHFEALGLPTSSMEDWRYTARALRPLANLDLTAVPDPVLPGSASTDSSEALDSTSLDTERTVFIDGHHAAALSSPLPAAGDRSVWDLASLLGGGPSSDSGDELLHRTLGVLAPIKRDAFAALNTAQFCDGTLVHIGAGRQLDRPLELVFLTSREPPAATFPRLAIRAEAASCATLIVDFRSASRAETFTNALIEVDLEANALLDLIVLQHESDRSIHVSRSYVRQGPASRLRSTTLTLGGRTVRNDLEIQLAGEGAEVDLDGLFLGLGEQHIDNHTLVDHAVPHCTSRERYKGILADQARGVFRGRIIVRPDAQKTAAEQSNPNLLIGDGAEIDSKPQLEIHADDVRCSHGSSTGQLDRDALFYLRARGITEPAARQILVQAFANEVTEPIRIPALRERVQDGLRHRLAEARGFNA